MELCFARLSAQWDVHRWGAAPGSIPGVGSPLLQWIFVSTDDGKTWTAPGPSVELRLSSPSELVAFSSSEAALVPGDADFPLRFMQEGGAT